MESLLLFYKKYFIAGHLLMNSAEYFDEKLAELVFYVIFY